MTILPESSVEIPEEQKEISSEIFELLQTQARMIGGKADLVVEIGEYGGGSFYNTETQEITIDPEHVLDEDDPKRGARKGLFVAGHEGAHHAISKNPLRLGLSKKEVYKKYSQLGYAFIHNAIEDPAVNDWAAGRFSGFKAFMNESYSGEFTREEFAAAQENGITDLSKAPRFLQYGFEVIRRWHQGWDTVSEDVDPEVTAVVEETKESAQKAIGSIPKYERDYFKKKSAQKRFEIIDQEIWPYVEQLVDKDMQELMEALQNMKQQPQQNSESDQSSQMSIPMESEDSADEESEIDDDQPGSGKGKKSEQEKDDSSGGSDSQNQDENDESSEGSNQSDASGGGEEDKEKSASGREGDDSSNLDGLSEAELEDLAREAEEILKSIEDDINDAMRSDDEDSRPPTHQEIKDDLQNSFGSSKGFGANINQAGAGKISEGTLDAFLGNLDNWHRTQNEVRPVINDLLDRLTPFFRAARHPKKFLAQSGHTPNMPKAMKLEAGLSDDLEIWERRTKPTLPKKKVGIFMDVSGSMAGVKDEQSFKGVVTMTEVFEMLGVEQFVGVFGNSAKIVFPTKGKLSDHRQILSKSLKSQNQSTATHKAAQLALTEFNQAKSDENFVIFVTDGMPNSDAQRPLKQIVEKLHAMKIPTIGVGLGAGTEGIREYFAFNLILEEFGKDDDKLLFSKEMAKLMEQVIFHRGPLLIEQIEAKKM